MTREGDSSFRYDKANKREFKNFAYLNSVCKKTFFELHCFALRFLYVLWCNETCNT